MYNNKEVNDLESPKTSKNNKVYAFNIIKQGWDKLSLEYDSIVKNVKSFNDSLDEEHKKNFKSIIISLEKFKDDFKNVIFNISLSIGNISSNSANKNNNEININLSVKDSYDKIYNEFLELESQTKKLISNQNKIQQRRSNHFQNIEKKLQGYLEEINEFDFKKINKNLNKLYENNNLNSINDKETINILLQKNNCVEKYSPDEYKLNDSENNKNEEEEINDDYEFNNDFEKEDIKNKIEQSENNNTNKENSENMNIMTDEKDIKLLNEIVNMNGLNQDEAIKYIKLLVNKEKKKNNQK
jgi:hypothetical protein